MHRPQVRRGLTLQEIRITETFGPLRHAPVWWPATGYRTHLRAPAHQFRHGIPAIRPRAFSPSAYAPGRTNGSGWSFARSDQPLRSTKSVSVGDTASTRRRARAITHPTAGDHAALVTAPTFCSPLETGSPRTGGMSPSIWRPRSFRRTCPTYVPRATVS